jgi:hypothetical protein
MNEVIIYFILFIIIYIFNNVKEETPILITHNHVPIVNEEAPPSIKKLTVNNSVLPSLRGYIAEYNGEEGGIKPFKHIVMNDENMTANQVNYINYESYRKKPVEIIK